MNSYPVRQDEEKRISLLEGLALAGMERTPDLDCLVAMACDLCETPIGLITVVDRDTQWIAASHGFDAPSTPREQAFCNYAIHDNSLVIVENAAADPRFTDNALVNGPLNMRFYAGVPLTLGTGMPIGTLCVIDNRPRTISAAAVDHLRKLARIADNLLLQQRDAERVARLSTLTSEYGRRLADQARELAMQKRILEEASELGEMGAFEHDMRTGEMRWSASMKRIHDLDPEGGNFDASLDFAHLKRFYTKKDLQRYARAVRKATRERSMVDIETPLRTARGRKRWVRLRVDFEYDKGEAVRRFGMMQDVTRQKLLHDRLDYLANRDSLTGLYNRNYFLREADRFLADHAGRLRGVAVFDLDGFKAINDSYGHVAGDACLKAVARRLRRACGEDFLLVRPGGDEFTVVFAMDGVRKAARDYFEVLRHMIQEPIKWKGLTFQVSASIGISILSAEQPPNAMELVQEADLAVYKAKAAGRNCVASYSSDLHETALNRFNVISRARAALENGEFELFYQPKVSLEDRALNGFEALLRWRQADGSYAPPGQFLAALEDPEMSRRIGEDVIRQAVRQAEAWHAEKFNFGNIAINVSSSQFVGRSFVDDLIARMDAAGLRPDDIQVEVTEGVLLSTGASSVTSGLKKLSDHGIKIAFDDFGTGYASLVHLRQLEFDIIKLDMSFVQSMLTSSADMAIVQSVLLLANRLGKTVIAEGVETETQFELLKAYGCHVGQGYLFSRPKHPAAILDEWGCRMSKAG
jgi:diguanylate cyclase (GGDEF)-like protein